MPEPEWLAKYRKYGARPSSEKATDAPKKSERSCSCSCAGCDQGHHCLKAARGCQWR